MKEDWRLSSRPSSAEQEKPSASFQAATGRGSRDRDVGGLPPHAPWSCWLGIPTFHATRPRREAPIHSRQRTPSAHLRPGADTRLFASSGAAVWALSLRLMTRSYNG